MNKKILFLSAFSLITSGTLQAQTPFPAGVTVGISKPGLNSAAKNYTIYTTTTPQSGNYNVGVSFTPAHDLNGIGLDSIDHFVYASTYTGENNTNNLVNGVSLFRIGADGTTVNLGYLPMSGQTSIEFASFSAGTVSSDDAYYYLTMGLKPSGVNKMILASGGAPLNLDTSDVRIFLCWKNNISMLPANPNAAMGGTPINYYEVDFSNPELQSAMQAFLNDVNAQFPNVYNAEGGIQDIAINPADNNIYGYFSYPENNATVGRPIVFAPPASGMVVASPVGSTINGTPNQEIDGIVFDTTGNLYGIFTTGDYAQINLSTGALSNVAPSNFNISSGNMRGDLGSISGIPYSTTTLAVKFVKFDGNNSNNTNILQWETASEDAYSKFIIERSENRSQWVPLSTIQSKAGQDGNNSLNYTFNDTRYSNTINYYRLIHEDQNGYQVYSRIVAINNADKSFNTKLYPNPASEHLYISNTQEGQTVILINMEGKIIYSVPTKATQTILKVDHLPTGMYQLTVKDAEGSILAAEKIMINK